MIQLYPPSIFESKNLYYEKKITFSKKSPFTIKILELNLIY
ncbi:hypothetical protein LEP1GSC088_0476 [Leptospira interrogans str. L1207]|nr:hypothetical protein LEP1GSC088_0476 [Leptospira interrogans str. L1207]